MHQYQDFHLVKEEVFSQGSLPYDKNLSINQHELESILSENLDPVIRGAELISFERTDEKISSRIQFNSKFYTIESKYLIGADGANSLVRKMLNIEFIGKENEEQAFTFDAKVTSELSKNTMFVHAHSDSKRRLVVVPLSKENYYKFSGGLYGDSPKIDQMHLIVEDRSKISIDPHSISGFSLYHTQSKLAKNFGDNKVILIGDAAHTFFPAGGYGLNMAVEDSFCLGWRMIVESHTLRAELIISYLSRRREEAIIFQGDVVQKKLELEKEADISIVVREQETQVYAVSSDDQFKRMPDDIYEQYSGHNWEQNSDVPENLSDLKINGFSFFWDPNKRKNIVVRPDLYYAEFDSKNQRATVKKTNKDFWLSLSKKLERSWI